MHKPANYHCSNCYSNNRNITNYFNSYNGRYYSADPKSLPNSSVKTDYSDSYDNDSGECIPRKGELVRNGGFENPHNSFHNWVTNYGVDVTEPGLGDTPHQGFTAARLGYLEPHALIYQDIPGICPGGFYQLSFFMSTDNNQCNPPIIVRLEFLDKHKHPLENPALDILIPPYSLFEAYSSYINATRWPSPKQAHFLRLIFETDTIADADGYVKLDDVSLIAL